MRVTQDGKVPVFIGTDDDRSTCPTCGMSIRLERTTTGEALRYVPRIAGEDVASVLTPQHPKVAKRLRELRRGKKTVAIVGLSPTSCSLAPFDDRDVEIWGLNEGHAFQQGADHMAPRRPRVHADPAGLGVGVGVRRPLAGEVGQVLQPLTAGGRLGRLGGQ